MMKSILVFIVFVSAVCLWFFVEQRPNKKYRNIAIVFLVMGSILIYVDNKKNEKINETKPKQEEVVKKEKNTEESSSKKEATESSTEINTETSSDTAPSSSSEEPFDPANY